jgi:hypothetical protein
MLTTQQPPSSPDLVKTTLLPNRVSLENSGITINLKNVQFQAVFPFEMVDLHKKSNIALHMYNICTCTKESQV